MKQVIIALCALGMAMSVQATLIYQDDFTSDPVGGAVWNSETGSAVTYDAANDQVDYDHTAGTLQRWMNHNTGLFLSTQGYLKTVISNHAGAPNGVWVSFVEDNTGNNGNYIETDVTANGTFELVFNNSSASIPYNNGAGWSGTLTAGTGLFSTDGTTTAGTLTFGAGVTSDVNIKGFGFANFGNGTVFPTASFSVDSIVVHDSAVVPEPSVIGLLCLGIAGLMSRRKQRA